jgi:5,10-methylenetetrahydromethanopterin reductase
VTAFDLGVVPRNPAPEVVDLCVEAEALGFGGVWVADSQSAFRESYTLLGAVAARTSRILLSTGVTNPMTRHPAVLASAHATLAELAPGRVVLTLGRGESSVRTAALARATTRQLEEAVVALRTLLAGESASWNGADIRMAWPTAAVPIYITASGPRTLRLGGRIGDGVLFQVGAEPELIRWALEQIEAGARESGRRLSDLTLCARIGCVVADDREQARDLMRPYAASAAKTVFDSVSPDALRPELVEEVRALRERYDYYEQAGFEAPHRELLTPALIDAVAVSGTPADVVPRLRQIRELGVDRVVLTFAASDPRPLARRLAERVLPQLA